MFRARETLVTEPPDHGLSGCVIVPVRDEEELLPSALRALAEQKTLSGCALPHDCYEVILLINNTTDRSRQVAESFQRLYPTFRLHIAERTFGKSDAHVGRARRLLMDEACRRLEAVERPDAAILSTDADSQVAPNWIAQNQNELLHGAEAVGGRVVIPSYEEDVLDPAVCELYRFDNLYRRLVGWLEDRFDPESHDPWPRHHHHFGASLAVTARVYKAVGRLPPRRHLEDLAFYAALMRQDVRLRHSNRVRVFTSARLAGRARFGLSTRLNNWTKHRKSALRMPVECATFLEQLFTARRQLRLLWKKFRNEKQGPTDEVRELARKSRMNLSRLEAQTRKARFFGALLEDVKFYEVFRNSVPDSVRLAPLRYTAEELLEMFKDQAFRRPATVSLQKATRRLSM